MGLYSTLANVFRALLLQSNLDGQALTAQGLEAGREVEAFGRQGFVPGSPRKNVKYQLDIDFDKHYTFAVRIF